MFLIPRLVKKHSETWEKQFDFKRRASIESRRRLLSSTESGPTMQRNSFLEIEVFSPENGNTSPVTQIAVERPNYTRGRRRSLPALYINNPSPNLSAEKPCLSPGLQKIVRLSAEMSSDDRVNSTDSPVLSSASGGNLATDKPRPSRMRARRCSLPAIAYKPGNPAQGDTKPPRVAQLLLVDANLLAQQGIPLVSVNTPPKVNRNKRRGSLPAVNYPNIANTPSVLKPIQPKTYNLSRRRGSLPAVSLTIPEESHNLGEAGSDSLIAEKNSTTYNLSRRRGSLPAVNHPNIANTASVSKPIQPKTYNLSRRRGSLPAVSLTIPEESHNLGGAGSDSSIVKKNKISLGLNVRTDNSMKDSIDELEEEGHQDHAGQCMTDRSNLRSEQLRLSTASSGYDTNGCSPAEAFEMGLLAENTAE